jgi:hypothetical protein
MSDTMTQPEENLDRPDVEAIVNKIRADLQRSESGARPADEAAVRVENDLHGNLDAANRDCAVGQIKMRGLKGHLLRCFYKPLGSLIAEINQFHSSAIRVLNRLVKILECRDPAASELIDKTQRRLDLLEKLGRRLDAVDDLRIEERLSRIERQLSKTQEKDEP